jgi:23S rRNA (cytidine1920-2'-O)/16S rRNA (cytidine1409-2'-O)-methyltransferase
MRADELLLLQGLAESRSKAKALILAGDVRVGDRVILKPSELVAKNTPLQLRERLPFVSRGGLKLEHAFRTFDIDVEGTVAADVGASTGGFTDVLLQRGASRVYAIDVGYGQLDYRLRSDTRVIVMERVNARYLGALPEPVGFISIDVSFISLEHILPMAARWLRGSGDVVALVKPQFEAGRRAVGRGGVVRDEGMRRATVERVIQFAECRGLSLRGVVRSPITGPAGNEEFLVWFDNRGVSVNPDAVLQQVFNGKGPG